MQRATKGASRPEGGAAQAHSLASEKSSEIQNPDTNGAAFKFFRFIKAEAGHWRYPPNCTCRAIRSGTKWRDSCGRGDAERVASRRSKPFWFAERLSSPKIKNISL